MYALGCMVRMSSRTLTVCSELLFRTNITCKYICSQHHQRLDSCGFCSKFVCVCVCFNECKPAMESGPLFLVAEGVRDDTELRQLNVNSLTATPRLTVCADGAMWVT